MFWLNQVIPNNRLLTVLLKYYDGDKSIKHLVNLLMVGLLSNKCFNNFGHIFCHLSKNLKIICQSFSLWEHLS